MTKRPQSDNPNKIHRRGSSREIALRHQLEITQKQIDDLLTSTSWRVTWPIRKIRDVIIRLSYLLKKRRLLALMLPARVRSNNTGTSARIMSQELELYKAIEKKNWTHALESTHTFFDMHWRVRFIISVVDRLRDIDDYRQIIREYQDKRSKSKSKKPRIAVYTCVTNEYESPKLPEVLCPEVDYILFTENPIYDAGVFKIRRLPYFNDDPSRTARFIKTHPHWLLAEYDYAIWIDASIMITGDIMPTINDFIDSSKPIACIPHPHRKTIYEEYQSCVKRGKDLTEDLTEQITEYRKQGFDGTGMIESGLMMFDLGNPASSKLLNDWWTEIDKFSKRDQISLPYVINKNKTAWHPLTKHPHSIRDHRLFVLCPHDSDVDYLMTELAGEASNYQVWSEPDRQYVKIKSDRVRAHKDQKIDIVVCVHNALDDVKLCLRSVVKHRKNSNHNLVIVDDGSDTPTAEYLKKFVESTPWASLIRHKTAKGYTKATIAGVKASTGDIVILLNSDTIVTDSWVEKMADALDSSVGSGIVSPMSNAAGTQSLPDYLSRNNQTAINKLPKGMTAEDMNKLCEKWTSDNHIPYVTMLHGFCFGIKRDVIDSIGLFDERNFPKGYGEENDYCFRAVNAGFGLVVATHTFIEHEKSKSYSRDTRVALMKQGAEKLQNLHGRRRITNAIRSMQENPTLKRLRKLAEKLY